MSSDRYFAHHLFVLVFTARCYAERCIALAGRPSVRPSVCDAEVSWFTSRLECLENNFVAD